MAGGIVDGHMAAEAVTTADNPTHDPNDPPKSWGRRRFATRALLVIAVVAAGVWVALSNPAGELDGTSWERVSADGITATARFEDGTISGNGPVNLYSAEYEARRNGSFSVGALTQTERGAGPALMQAEADFFGALGEATRFSIEGDILRLDAGDGSELLRFRRVE